MRHTGIGATSRSGLMPSWGSEMFQGSVVMVQGAGLCFDLKLPRARLPGTWACDEARMRTRTAVHGGQYHASLQVVAGASDCWVRCMETVVPWPTRARSGYRGVGAAAPRQ